MVLLKKHYVSHRDLLRDARPASVRIKDYWNQTDKLSVITISVVVMMMMSSQAAVWADVVLVLIVFYARWVLVST
ncbi:MAG TPA: hypothetical protein DCY07_06205, partial [Rhodospirillaceae bacterium]|nr:hypothetical protein [Rhodospirillaceae bacterium]